MHDPIRRDGYLKKCQLLEPFKLVLFTDALGFFLPILLILLQNWKKNRKGLKTFVHSSWKWNSFTGDMPSVRTQRAKLRYVRTMLNNQTRLGKGWETYNLQTPEVLNQRIEAMYLVKAKNLLGKLFLNISATAFFEDKFIVFKALYIIN